MTWSVEYFNEDVKKRVLELPAGLLARYLRLADLMMEFGPNLGMPHTRAVESNLLELRVKGKEGIARVLYCTRVGRRIVVLHVFVKKSQKTPGKELKIARQRLRKVIHDGS